MDLCTCMRLDTAISEYAVGEKADLEPGEREAVESHLAICEACRDKLEEYRGLHRGLRLAAKKRGLGEPMPDADFERFKARTMDAVRQTLRNAAAVDECLNKPVEDAPASDVVPPENTEKCIPMSRQSKVLSVLRWAAAVAAVVVFAIGVYCHVNAAANNIDASVGNSESATELAVVAHKESETQPEAVSTTDIREESTDSVETAKVAQAPVKEEEPSLRQQFDAAKTPEEALALLQKAYEKRSCEEAASSPAFNEDMDELILLSEGLITRWPESAIAGEAYKLQSFCWESLGEMQQAKKAYLAFADFKAEQTKKKVLAETNSEEKANEASYEVAYAEIRKNALAKFAKKDYLTAVGYADVLLSRYPNTEAESFSHYMVGRYCYASRQNKEAIKAYENLFAKDPDGKWAKFALGSYTSALSNIKQNSKAAEIWLAAAEKTDNRKEQANYLFNSAAALMPFQENAPKTMALLRKVENEYPDTGFANYARKAKVKLNERMMDKVMPVGDLLNDSGT